MFAGSRSRSQKSRDAKSAHGLVVLTTFLGLWMTMAMSGAAQACPSGKPLATSEPPPAMTASLELKTDVQLVGVTSRFFPPKIDITRSGIGCCDGAHHSNGADCASSSCSACSAVLPGMTRAAAIEDRTGGYALSRQAPLNFANPDSQFRPPRQLV